MLCQSVRKINTPLSQILEPIVTPPVKQFAHPWIRRTLNLGLMV